MAHAISMPYIYKHFKPILIMEYTTLGKTTVRISAIGIGTWKMPNGSEQAVRVLRHAFENGINFVDTAEMYANEETVGKAIEGQDGIFMATKVSPAHFHYDDVIEACKRSISRLGVKSIGLYQLHWPNNRIPIAETMKAMEWLRDENLIDNIGVSNFSVDEMVAAQEALDHSKIVSNQVEYSFMVRDAENGLLDFCNKESITLIAYSPLGRGAIRKGTKEYETLSEIGNKYGKSAAQVALNYLISGGAVVPIPKSLQIDHLDENLGAVGWRLSKQDYEKLRIADGAQKKPLAGRMLKAFLKNTTAWSVLMEKIEKRRKK